jgi:hypothetical protein
MIYCWMTKLSSLTQWPMGCSWFCNLSWWSAMLWSHHVALTGRWARAGLGREGRRSSRTSPYLASSSTLDSIFSSQLVYRATRDFQEQKDRSWQPFVMPGLAVPQMTSMAS